MTIVTLTLNPTLDESTSVELIEPWHKLRCDDPRLEPGGGGINVARVVNELGGTAVAIAALGGHVGSQIADALVAEDIALERIPIRGQSRQSFSVSERVTSRQYRFVHAGPELSLGEWSRCLDATLEAARASSCVVVSGSVPPGVPEDGLAVLARRLAPTGVPLILDASGPALVAALREPVHLIKPSLNELKKLTGEANLARRIDIEGAARRLIAGSRCEIVVVSLGAQGAIMVPAHSEALVLHAPTVAVTSSIGAGDSMVGGMAIAIAAGQSLSDIARLGVACGTAAVTQPGTSLCSRHDVDELLPQVVIERSALSADRGHDDRHDFPPTSLEPDLGP